MATKATVEHAQTDDIRRCMCVHVINLSFWCRRAAADDGVMLQRLLCAAFCFGMSTGF